MYAASYMNVQRKSYVFARCCVYLGTSWLFPHVVVSI